MSGRAFRRSRFPGAMSRGALSVPCPDCASPVGSRCYVFRVDRGVRHERTGWRVRPHPARVAASRGRLND